MQEVLKELKRYGYVDSIIYKDDLLLVESKDRSFSYDDLFFVDAGFRVLHSFIFAISAPKYDVKGVLTLDLNQYHTLATTAFASKFHIEIKQDPTKITIPYQYGMRKISPEEFDPKRYILRVGFDDFPSCPYGNTFGKLGYDKETKSYVRLHKKILKDENLTIQYKEK